MNLYYTIKNEYTLYFSKYETSKNVLLVGILYSIELLSINEFNNLKQELPNYFEKMKCHADTEADVLQLFMSFILNKLAIKIIYNLPHMLNKLNENSSISPHIIFGENIAQLIAFCLITEGSNILNQLHKKYKKTLHNVNSTNDEDEELILNYENSEIPKNIIIDDYNKKNKSLIQKYQHYFKLFYNT